MSINLREYMNTRSVLLDMMVDDVEKRIACFPEGSVYVKIQKGKAYYYQYAEKSGEKFLGKNEKDVIGVYVQKDYLRKVLRAAKQERSALHKLKEIYPKVLAEDIYDQLPESRRKFATPIVPGDREFARQWLEKPYDRLGFRSDMPEYITIKGDRVRSKSEMIIADRLWANGIPYKYECPLVIGNAVIHPDFTILRLSDRKIIYHEHCGMMDNDDYREDMVDRVNEYNLEGIYLGDRLFLSFESSETPLDARVIDNLIKTHYR